MKFQMEPYIFCEQSLSDYEKTIYTLAIAYGAAPIYALKKEQIQEIACFLEVDFELLYKALESEVYFSFEQAIIQFGEEAIDCGGYFKNTFFDAIIRVYFAYKNLEDIFDSTEEEEVVENICIFNSVSHLFDIVNAITATYECMYKNVFSLENTMYDSAESFSPRDYINFLKFLVMFSDCLEYDKALLRIVTMILKYEFQTRINALYFVTICQILKHSPCFSAEVNGIANDMYNKLFHILKNGKIIATSVNILHTDISKPLCERTKNDNTTRLQILYGYPNYDCYELRLDLPHKGQDFIHLNNETPGGISCCIFTEEEYKTVINEHPELKESFISYNGQWTLKERNNCNLTCDLMTVYDDVRKSNAHDTIFSSAYSENEIIKFINVVAHMLPKDCLRAIDTNGHYAKNCFDYDIIMRNTTILYLAYLEHDYESVEKLFKDISNKAFRYGLISEEEKGKEISFDTVLEIVRRARERIA